MSKYKAALYMRISNSDAKAGESESLANQRKLLMDFVAKNPDIEVACEHLDDGVTGLVYDRPAFNELMKDIIDGKVNCAITKDISRFSRDYILLGDYLSNIFPFLKIRFIAINDCYDSINENGNGLDIDMQFKTLYYDLFSKELSEKVSNSLKQIKSQGKNTNWAAPFGYIKDPNNKYHIIIDKKTAFIVKEAFDLILRGYSCTQIANIFNGKGYITRSERKEELKLSDYTGNLITGSRVKKRVWTSACISQITRNELYTGDYVYNKYKETRIGRRKKILLPEEEWKVIHNTHEAIISREVFDEVKSIKEKRKFYAYTGKKNHSIFSGKIFCKECGRPMSFRCDNIHKKNSDKEYKYKSYYCYFCKAEKTPNNVKENVIIELIKPKLNEFKGQNTVKQERTINYENIRENIQKEISVLNCNLQIIYEDYKKHSISKEEYLKDKTLIQDKKILLENRLDEFQSDIVNSEQETDSTVLNEEGLLKAYVDNMIDKIIVSRAGEIEIAKI